jgi:hypothetical protein
MTQPRNFLAATAITAALLGTSALAQDATIYYETPTIRSGQPVANPVPVVQPVQVPTPMPNSQPTVVQTPTGTTYVPAPATPSTPADGAYLGTPQAQVSQYNQSVTFVSGGIGQFEKQWFDANSSSYKLKVTYSDTTGHHLAGVNVTLADSSGNTVLTTVTDGPYLLVNTKPGTYSLTSDYQGVTQTKKVSIGKGTSRTGVTFHDLES